MQTVWEPQAPDLIVIHKSLREQQNPEGVQAISRGLSEATPPDGKTNKTSTPEGSQSFLRGLSKRSPDGAALRRNPGDATENPDCAAGRLKADCLPFG